MARVPGIDGLISLLHTRTGTLAQLPSTVSGAVRGLADVATEARETLAALHRVALRVDAITEELEGPLVALAPGLRRLAAALDDPVVSRLPTTVQSVQDDLLPVLRTLADTHERVAFIAGSTERIMTFVEETSRTLSGLPGAGLLGRRRPPPPPGRVITVEQVDRDR